MEKEIQRWPQRYQLERSFYFKPSLGQPNTSTFTYNVFMTLRPWDKDIVACNQYLVQITQKLTP